jgi:hypothetical protein
MRFLILVIFVAFLSSLLGNLAIQHSAEVSLLVRSIFFTLDSVLTFLHSLLISNSYAITLVSYMCWDEMNDA